MNCSEDTVEVLLLKKELTLVKRERFLDEPDEVDGLLSSGTTQAQHSTPEKMPKERFREGD